MKTCFLVVLQWLSPQAQYRGFEPHEPVDADFYYYYFMSEGVGKGWYFAVFVGPNQFFLIYP